MRCARIGKLILTKNISVADVQCKSRLTRDAKAVQDCRRNKGETARRRAFEERRCPRFALFGANLGYDGVDRVCRQAAMNKWTVSPRLSRASYQGTPSGVRSQLRDRARLQALPRP